MDNIIKEEGLTCSFCKSIKPKDTIMIQGIKNDVYICTDCLKVCIDTMVSNFIYDATLVLEDKVIKLGEN